MTFEEVEKAIQFSLDRQAQTEAILQQVAESHAQAEKRISRLEGAMVRGINLVGELAQYRKKAEEEMAEFRLSHEETKERLDAFIIVLERFISEQRNGKGRNDQSANGQ